MKRRDIFRSFINGTRTGKALLMALAALVTIATVTSAAQGRRGPKVKSITVEAVSTGLLGTTGKSIGEGYGGGVIVYILAEGESIGYIDANGNAQAQDYEAGVQHGLIAATQDQGSNGIIWAVASKDSTSVPGGTATALGSGAANTLSIIAQNGAGDTYAAGLARAYDGGGYSDWYLPSKEELNEVLRNKNSLVGWYNSDYWSSSESEASKAYAQSWSGLEVKEITKDYSRRVRPVRAF